MDSHLLSLSILFFLFAGLATATNISDTCNLIARNISHESAVFFPASPVYVADIEHALGSSSENATCSVEPGNPEDVANILIILSNTRTPWAVKSGGHATNKGWSSTSGVQITLSRLNSTVYDPETKLATIRTGQLWETVYTSLEPYNVSVAGGRVSGVGVGGFTLGGGYSWLTNQVGLSCDNVVEYELVTPMGRILTVTNNTYPDLFFGLKGGGNNFGVVTQMKMRTHVQGPVFGGLIVINGDNLSQANEAVSKFQDFNTDPKASMGVTYGYDPSLNGTFVSFFLFYDGASPPAGTFDDIFAIPAVSSDVAPRSLSTLVGGLFGPSTSPRGNWRSVSLKNYTVPLLENIVDQISTFGPDIFNHSGTQFTFAVEPVLTSIFTHESGPSAYIHDANNFFAPSTVLATWNDNSQDDYIFEILKQVDASVVAFGESEGQDIVPPNVVLYPNYASFDTPSEMFFGRNLPSLRDIQTKYDPLGLTNLTGGWKFF